MIRNGQWKNTVAARPLSAVGLAMVGLGAALMIAPLVYMLANLQQADRIVSVCIPLIVAGVVLSLLSLLFRKDLPTDRRQSTGRFV